MNKYVQGNYIHMSWREIFQEPDIVKNANASDLDPSGEDALVISGLRIDNPAAAWVAKATIKAHEFAGTSFNKYASEQVDKACKLFDITDDMFEFKDVEGYSFVVKEAGMNADFCILSQDSFEQAVHGLFDKRANAPYSFCKECARQLADVKSNAHYLLDNQDNIRLQKMAGNLNFNAEQTADAIRQRALYIRDYKGNYEEYQSLSKLANACEKVSRENNAVITNEIINSIDEIDRKYDFMGKFASHNFTPIEEVAYLTYEESLIKEASDIIEIDDVHTMTKRPFMIPETCDEMAKWASDNGYATTADPDDIIDCVSSMSESLRAEFVQLFS